MDSYIWVIAIFLIIVFIILILIIALKKKHRNAVCTQMMPAPGSGNNVGGGPIINNPGQNPNLPKFPPVRPILIFHPLFCQPICQKIIVTI